MTETIRLTGRVIQPADPGFEAARQNFNERIQKHPKVVVFCQNTMDVQNAVRYARAHSLPVAARCGRHNYENFSLIDDGLVIDVSDLTTLHIDAELQTLDVGSGTQLIEIYTKVSQQGFAFPGGICPTVGISGLTLGGGIGLLTRWLGMTCDSLLEVELVNAQGEVLVAHAEQHPDLFWACRGGGGGNFGVLTRLKFQLHKIEEVSIFQAAWEWKDLPAVIQNWQRWGQNLDPRLTSILMLHGPDKKEPGSAIASGMFVGSREDLQQNLDGLLVLPPQDLKVQTMPYLEGLNFFTGDPQPDWAAYWHGSHRKFKNTSAFAYQLLPEEGIETIVKHLEKSPAADNLVQFETLGGRVSQVPVEATAFPHRAAQFSLQYQAYWAEDSEEKEHLDWVNGFRKDMLPYTRGAYMNYPDVDIEDFGEMYYGPNLQRLQQVKASYDPEGFFGFAQSIDRSLKVPQQH
ncbi:FAD-binding oxidoreductase [Deinococcus roseus]|uniref:FAD-binding protein n=1 Tax=Deinococcus roseus TaxID=392414 RepID=A0ABQ2CYC0_9DEIO|nr:FAD-binding oxidoreductase [Deinococcus roseus]GGJ32643.1 FAD-binding protein [Deinococcus roseus]